MFYCCDKVYKSILSVRNQHENFCQRPLHLVLRTKNAAVSHADADFAYEKQLNGQVKSYDVTIVLCQLGFRNMPKLNKERDCM